MFERQESTGLARFTLGQAILGFGLAITAAILTIALGMTIRPGTPNYISSFELLRTWIIFGCGFVQWIYVLPLLFVFHRRGRNSLAAGFFVAAVILLSLNLAGLAYLARHPFHM